MSNESEPLFFDKNQLALLDESEIGGVIFSAEERKGVYTGERLLKHQPHIYKAVALLLAEGYQVERIHKALGVHKFTIKAVWKHAANLIEREKKDTANNWQLIRNTATDKIFEGIQDLEVKTWQQAQQASVLAGIATEKGELMTGNATARVERKAEGLEDIKAHLANLPKATGPVIDADYEITGFSGEIPGVKGDAADDQADEGPERPGSA